jgi:predicted PolB exonuclease-like 3'-5' exonuclease
MKPVLVFDIETIPDVEGLRRLHALDPALSDDEVAELAFQQRRAASGNDFLPLHLQRVAVISCVLRVGKDFRVWSLAEPEQGEARDHSTLLRRRRQVHAADGVLERRRI